MLALAHSGSLDLPFLIPFGFFFPVVRLVDEVLGGDSSYSRCRFPSAEIPIPANTRAHHLALSPCHLVRVRAHYASVESIEVKLKELNDMIKNYNSI